MANNSNISKGTASNMENSKENPSFPVMTINMNGPPKKGYARGRETLLPLILEKFCSDIIFCQEIPKTFPQEEMVRKGYESVKNGEEVGIMWSTKNFTQETKITDENVTQLLDNVLQEIRTNLLSRMTMAKLTSKQNTAMSTLAVSYHGKYSRYSEEKRRIDYSILLVLLREVTEMYGINSFIIGGDFNFNTLEFKYPDGVFGSYDLMERSKDNGNRKIEYKDNFFTFPNKILEVDKIKAIDLTGFELKDFKAIDLLDHDPIVGVLSFVTVSVREFDCRVVKQLRPNVKKRIGSLGTNCSGEGKLVKVKNEMLKFLTIPL